MPVIKTKTKKKKTAGELLDWIKSWTPEQAKEYRALAVAIENARASIEPPIWAIKRLSGACKLHYHNQCGYSECRCICHSIKK